MNLSVRIRKNASEAGQRRRYLGLVEQRVQRAKDQNEYAGFPQVLAEHFLPRLDVCHLLHATSPAELGAILPMAYAAASRT